MKKAQRIIIKVGSSSLVLPSGKIKDEEPTLIIILCAFFIVYLV